MKQIVVKFGGCKQSFGVLTVSLALCFPQILLGAQSVTLAWDPNPESDVVGYRLHYGESSTNLSQMLDVGNATNAMVSSLLGGHTYYFAVCAYNSAGLASDFSNQIQFTVPTSGGNLPPVASNSSVQGPEDQPIAVVLSASDPDGNPLTYVIVTPPAKGSLSGSAPNLTYRPQTNYNGADSFTFRVNDGTTNSATATVSITVTAVNDAPVASNASVSTAEDTPVAITLVGSDADGSALTYAIVSAPTRGALSGSAPNLTYRPQTNYNGADSFTFRVNDGTTNSATATVSITVTAVNDAPVASNASVSTAEDTPVAITLVGSDADGSALTYAIVSAPTRGALSGSAPNLTYTPQANFNGADSFTFRVNDGTTNSATATVSVTITPVNDAPVAASQSGTATAGTPANILLTGTDVDGDSLTYAVVTPPLHGLLSGQPPNLTYTPQAAYSGSDTFTFKVNDGKVDSATASVSITVVGGNTAPVAINKSVTTPEDQPLGVVLSASDAEGNTLTYVVVSGPAKGSLSGQAPDLTYTPQTNYYGSDTFTFKVNDGTLDSGVATVSITITPVNDTPVAQSRSVTMWANTATNVVLSASDVDGDPLTYGIVTPPVHGLLTGQAPNLTYTPQANYWGSDSFTFKVNDGQADSAPATVSISVKRNNSAPNGRRKKLSTVQDVSLAVALEADDADGDALTYEVITTPTNGTLSGVAPNLTYTPNAGFVGEDSLTFVANDGMTNSPVALVSITVVPPDQVPQITDVSFNGAGLQLTWSAVVGKTYRVSYKDSLDAATWTTAAEALVADSAQLYWVDSEASSSPRRFYIVELVNP